MYCTNCGKEIKEDYKFCKYCGNNIKEERQEKNIKEKSIEENSQEKGMKYYNFFSKVYLSIIIVINIIALGNYINIENWDVYLFMQFLLDIILYIVLPIALIDGMQKRTEFMYKLVMTFLILDYIYKVVLVSVTSYINNPYTNITIYILLATIMYAIWFVPNIIYFVKRRKIFKD